MQTAAACRPAGGMAGRSACERRAAAALLPQRPHTRRRTLPHDGAATELHFEAQQLWQQPDPEGMQLNNAVEHSRRSQRPAQPELPLRVECLLSSPSLERPDGTGELLSLQS